MPGVEGTIEVQSDRRAELVHGLTFQTDEECESVTVLFDTNALGGHGMAPICNAIVRSHDASGLVRTLR